MAILEIDDLSKDYRSDWTYRRTRVLDSLQFSMRPGEILGLIGPNGAGKTTTFKLILGLLRPTRGRILFRGNPISVTDRAAIGFLPEQPYFYDHLRVDEALRLFGRLCGMKGSQLHKRVDEVIDLVGVGHKHRAALQTLSKGTLQRVGIAQAILNRPQLLVLDEPMSGLDPAGRRDMRHLIQHLCEEGTSVLFSSHILPDAEALCHRVAILSSGRLREIVAMGDNDAMAFALAVSGADQQLVDALGAIAGETPARNGNAWHVNIATHDAVDRAIDAIRQHGGTLESLTRKHTSLEEVFLEHVGDGPTD